jgi:cbb3-type cytochrome oxidase maturation protein
MDMAVYLIVAALLLGLGSWLVFVWAAKSGQFRDVESIKYKVLANEREGPGPAGSDPDGPSGAAKEEKR